MDRGELGFEFFERMEDELGGENESGEGGGENGVGLGEGGKEFGGCGSEGLVVEGPEVVSEGVGAFGGGVFDDVKSVVVDGEDAVCGYVAVNIKNSVIMNCMFNSLIKRPTYLRPKPLQTPS